MHFGVMLFALVALLTIVISLWTKPIDKRYVSSSVFWYEGSLINIVIHPWIHIVAIGVTPFMTSQGSNSNAVINYESKFLKHAALKAVCAT